MGAWFFPFRGRTTRPRPRGAWLAGLILAAGFACNSVPGGPSDGAGGASGGGLVGAVGAQSSSGSQANAVGGGASTGGQSLGSGGASGGSAELGGESHAGGSDSPTGGQFAGLGGTFFANGARLVIPHKEQDLRFLVTPDFSQVPSPLEMPGGSSRIVDEPGYSREHRLTIDVPYFIDLEQCPTIIEGHLEVDSFEVTEDLDGSGAELTIEPNGDEFTLRHEGLGRHELRVEGVFIATQTNLCPARLNEAGEMPVSFVRTISVEALGAVRFTFPEVCAASPRVLSGQGFYETSFDFLDASGQEIYAENFDSSFPIDVTVETERAAEIAPPGNGLTTAGITIEGEPQLVRLSTRFGTLAIYELVSLNQVEDWGIRFYSRGGLGGIRVTELESGGTYPRAEALADELRTDIKLLIKGQPLCSALPADDFVTTANTPSVCLYVGFLPLNGTVMGLLTPTGTCGFDLALPAARDGDGLQTTLSATFVDEL
jgi:hypothetical protein